MNGTPAALFFVPLICGLFAYLAATLVLALWPQHYSVTENGKPCRHPKANVWVCT